LPFENTTTHKKTHPSRAGVRFYLLNPCIQV